MRTRHTVLIRWTAALQGVLLLPALIAGSICLREGEATALELGACACLEAPGLGSSPVLSSSGPAECGPCRDVILTAHAGPRLFECSDPSALKPHVPERPDAAALGSLFGTPYRPGSSPERSPTVLRC